MKLIKYVIIGILAMLLIGAGIAYYLYNKPHADLKNKDADFALKSDSLLIAFSQNEQTANTKYLNKIIDVSGTVAEMLQNPDSSLTIVLKDTTSDFGVSCNLLYPYEESKTKLSTGNSIVIRGVCSGYNGFEVALNNCTFPEK